MLKFFHENFTVVFFSDWIFFACMNYILLHSSEILKSHPCLHSLHLWMFLPWITRDRQPLFTSEFKEILKPNIVILLAPSFLFLWKVLAWSFFILIRFCPVILFSRKCLPHHFFLRKILSFPPPASECQWCGLINFAPSHRADKMRRTQCLQYRITQKSKISPSSFSKKSQKKSYISLKTSKKS